MSRHLAFRRQPVEQSYAQNLRTRTFPAPSKGLIESENESFMQPGGCLICDNWAPTMRGVKLRGGSIRHCDLHALDSTAWVNNTAYVIGNRRYDGSLDATGRAGGTFWDCAVNHTSLAAPSTFAQDRATAGRTGYWTQVKTGITRSPVISGFEYQAGNAQRIFAAQATKLFDVTSTLPVLIKSNQTSGNYVASQLANAAANPLGTNWMIVCNESGDFPLRFDGTSWVVLDGTAPANWANNTVYATGARAMDSADRSYWKCVTAHTSAAAGTFATDRTSGGAIGKWAADLAPDGAGWITGPVSSNVVAGRNLCYVWKYRNRLFFIEAGSMNVWYLGLNAVGGLLTPVPLAGAATRGGKLLFGASWSLDAGDGISEKCIFATDQGEVLIFEGSDPANAANWRQQGRYFLSPPLGMNAHIQVGGDMLLLTVDGIIPLSQAISKDSGQLDLAMLTRNIKPTWRKEVALKRAWPWTIKKWDEYGAMFVTTPGGAEGARYCLLVNSATGAWARTPGMDATCFMRLRADLYFGTQHGAIMLAERSGNDELWDEGNKWFGKRPYVAVLVGGWETFGAPANAIVWHQARASFHSSAGEPFQPQLAATVNYDIILPPPPPSGPDPGLADVWDQGIWCPTTPAYTYPTGPPGPGAVPPTATPPADIAAYLQWDQPAPNVFPVRNTLWVSIGETGFAHAPIVQITVSQQAPPRVELLSVSVTYEPAGVNV